MARERARDLKKIGIEVEGIVPILINRMTEDTLHKLRTGEKDPKSKTRGEMTPREEAAAKVYLDADGMPILPMRMLMSCLINAGQFVRLDGKRQMSSAKSTIVPGFLSILEPYVSIKPGDWEVDMQPGKNPNDGVAVCIVRPRFDRWTIAFTVVLDTHQIAETKCRELFDIALSRVGLGDFRPSRKGIYGRGVITEWNVQ